MLLLTSLIIVTAGSVILMLLALAMKDCKNFDIDRADIYGKLVIVTGANSGIGLYTSKYLVAKGAHVIMACRSLSKCEEARNIIGKTVRTPKHIDVAELNLASFSSIRKFVNWYKSKFLAVEVLVNNAGIMAIPDRQLTEDNLELQIGTNHFGHFLLTALLFPLFKTNGRIITHSSLAAFSTEFDDHFPYNNLNSDIFYNPWSAYGYSKKANLYFTFELNKRLQQHGNPRNLSCVAVHPGYTNTNLQRYTPYPFINHLFAMRVEHGSQAQLLAAMDHSIASSQNNVFGPRYLLFGPPAVTSTLTWKRSVSYHERAQEYLWNESVRVTGEDMNVEEVGVSRLGEVGGVTRIESKIERESEDEVEDVEEYDTEEEVEDEEEREREEGKKLEDNEIQQKDL